MADYHAQGKCFECGDTGHLSKDCLKRTRACPPANLCSASASVRPPVDTDHFDSLRMATLMGLLSISLDVRPDSNDLYVAVNEVLIAHTLHKLYNAVPFAQDFSSNITNDPMSPSCFQMELVTNNDFQLTDFHTGDTYYMR